MKSQIHRKPLIMLGAGGHAKVLLSLAHILQLNVIGVCAPEFIEKGLKDWRGIEVLGDGYDLDGYDPTEFDLINGIGQRINDRKRRLIFEKFKSYGYFFPALVHPSASVDSSAILQEGVQVMAGAVIQVDSYIGNNVIVNTGASIDHDCRVGDHVHIAPGAVLCGTVSIADDVFIATGSCLSSGIKVGERAIVGAGVSVVRDVDSNKLILPAAIRQTALNMD